MKLKHRLLAQEDQHLEQAIGRHHPTCQQEIVLLASIKRRPFS
jgi:hypothetical protein